MTAGPGHGEADRDVAAAFDAFSAVLSEDVRLPFADPKSAALTALLLTSYLSQPDVAKGWKGQASFDVDDFVQTIDRLRVYARAMTHLINRVGGHWFSNVGDALPEELQARCTGVKERMLAAATEVASFGEEKRWIDTIRRGVGAIDLVMDLRGLAEFYASHAAVSTSRHFRPGDVSIANGLAEQVCSYLATADGEERKRDRDLLHRAFTLFAPDFERVTRLGRIACGDQKSANRFPSLGTLSRTRKRNAPPVPAPKPPRPRPKDAVLPDPEVPGRCGPTGTLRPPTTGGIPISTAPSAPSTATASSSTEPIPRTVTMPIPRGPETAADPFGAEDVIARRAYNRATIDLEVGIASESNFYLGFTENLSQGGVFVATYALKPIGERVEIRLTLEREEIAFPGIVRWLRTPADAEDAWPGIGIQFEKLTPHQEGIIREFIRRRDAMFFDD